MKNKLKYIIFALLLAFGTSACSGFLDQTPDSGVSEENAIRNINDLEQLLIGVYSPLKSIYSGSVVIYPDLQTDLVQGVLESTLTGKDIYQWTMNAGLSDVSSIWSSCWSAIPRANFLINNAHKAEIKSDEEQERYNEIIGEARFIRALLYSEMIKIYSDPYGRKLGGEKIDPAKQMGLPVFNETGIAIQKRVDMQSYYQNMLDDLEIAETNIKRTGADNVYVTQAAVHALKARLFLYMEDWANAETEASYLINSTDYALLDARAGTTSAYANMWTYDVGSEIIFKISFSQIDLGGALGSLFWKNVNGKFYPDYVPANWVLNLYESDDARATIFFEEKQTVYTHKLKCPLLKKYPGNPNLFTSQNSNFVNMPKVFRLSEMYLIRAEARLELGREVEAITDLNLLRNKRITAPSTIVDARKTLQDERVRELIMEGHRLYDLKRWGMGFDREPQESTVSPSNDLEVEATNVFFTWPIPSAEMNTPGSEIVGNPSNNVQ